MQRAELQIYTPWQKREEITMISFNILIELVFSIIQLLADRPLGKPPQGCVASYLVLIWNELDCFERLLLFHLIVMNHFIRILRDGSGRYLGWNPGFVGGLSILLLYGTLLRLERYWKASGLLGSFNFTGEIIITMFSLLRVVRRGLLFICFD